MKALLKKLDAKLLPQSEHLRYSPYAWLAYLFFFFAGFYGKPFGVIEYSIMALGLPAFLYLYFNTHWVSGPRILFNIIGIVLIGSALTHISAGASVFFVYAGAFCCMLGSPRNATVGIATIVAYIILLSFALGLGQYFYLPATVFTVFIGGINIYYHEMHKKNCLLRLSQQEVQQLAQTAERERIARDLHDLIGHTFSVLTLKADLAGKLIERNPERAKKEIKDLENLSRDALSQVREVVSGFRSADLNAELTGTKYLLQSHDIDFDYELGELNIGDELNKELAIIVKELTTNIIKHANAGKVTASVTQDTQGIRLKMKDNGKGCKSDKAAGFGLKGIQERLQKWQGQLTINNTPGFEVTVFIAKKRLEQA